ncbi:MAG: hypothetical protein QOI96_1621 [Verrucomicrobiota bacterium]
MQRFAFLSLLMAFVLAGTVQAEGLAESKSKFYYKNSEGEFGSARIIRRYYWKSIVHPFATVDLRIDPKLRRAATIAQERANAHSKARCWQYVKEALLKSGAVSSYPKTAYAYQAGEELTSAYGFKRISVRDPYAAPLGSVLVYGGRGHVEIRTKDGFVSDYHSKNRCFYPLLAVYAKYSS